MTQAPGALEEEDKEHNQELGVLAFSLLRDQDLSLGHFHTALLKEVWGELGGEEWYQSPNRHTTDLINPTGRMPCRQDIGYQLTPYVHDRDTEEEMFAQPPGHDSQDAEWL